MKLSDYAKKVGVSHRAAWRWFKTGKIAGYQMDTGTIIITLDEPEKVQKVAIYASPPSEGDSFCARLHGRQGAKRKTLRITKSLKEGDACN